MKKCVPRNRERAWSGKLSAMRDSGMPLVLVERIAAGEAYSSTRAQSARLICEILRYGFDHPIAGGDAGKVVVEIAGCDP